MKCKVCGIMVFGKSNLRLHIFYRHGMKLDEY